MPRRVLLMASSMNGGGSELQTALLARHLDRSSFDVHLYLTHATGDLLSTIPGDVTIHSPPIDTPRRLRDRLPGGMLRRHAQWFADLVHRTQIDVIYDRTFHMTLIAGHVGVPHGCPRVSTIVSPPHVALPLVETRFVQMKRRRLADAYRRSAAVIAVSDAARQSAIDYYGITSNQIQTIRNPVDLDAIQYLAGSATSSPASDGFLRLVCVGRMTCEKGHATLIQSLPRVFANWPRDIPPMHLRLIGDGPDRHSIEKLVSDLELANGPHRIEFAGAITPASAEIAAADGLVLPSHFEGLPNVVLEAFALQTPVIATRAGGTVELQLDADHPTCFWADPADANSLADAVLRFAAEPSKRVTHIQNAVQTLGQNHDLASVIDRIAECLRRA